MKSLNIFIFLLLVLFFVSCKNNKDSNKKNVISQSVDNLIFPDIENTEIDFSKSENYNQEFIFDESILRKIKNLGVCKTLSIGEISKRQLSVQDDCKIKVYYKEDQDDDLSLITGVLYYLIQSGNEVFIGSYSNEFGLLDSNNQIIDDAELSYNKSFFQENVKGIDGESFLKSPLRLSALVKYNDNLPLCNSDCTDFLDIDMEKRSIKRWFPEF